MHELKKVTDFYMNQEAWEMALSVEPDIKRLLCVARPRIHAQIVANLKKLPWYKYIFFRPIVCLTWWAILRYVTPIYLRIHVEFFLQRRGLIALETCSEWLQRAQAGECAGEWDGPRGKRKAR